MTDRTDFVRACTADPGDLTRYLVFADWLDERAGDQCQTERAFAFALRWCAARVKFPHRREYYPFVPGRTPGVRRVPEKFSWAWYCESLTPRSVLNSERVPDSARLPRLEFLSFGGFREHTYCGSWPLAIDALAVGLDYMRKSVTL